MKYLVAIAFACTMGAPCIAEEETKTTTVVQKVASVTSRSDAPIEVERTIIPSAQAIANSRLAVRRVTRRLVTEHNVGEATAPAIGSVSKADVLLSTTPRIVSITALANEIPAVTN